MGIPHFRKPPYVIMSDISSSCCWGGSASPCARWCHTRRGGPLHHDLERMQTMTWRGDAVEPFWSWTLMNYKGAAQLHKFRKIIKFVNFSHLKSDFETLKPHISQSCFAGLKWLCLKGSQPVPARPGRNEALAWPRCVRRDGNRRGRARAESGGSNGKNLQLAKQMGKWWEYQWEFHGNRSGNMRIVMGISHLMGISCLNEIRED